MTTMNTARTFARRITSQKQWRKFSTTVSSTTPACVTPLLLLKDVESHHCNASMLNSSGNCSNRNFSSSNTVHHHSNNLDTPRRKLEVDYDELKTLLQTDSVLLLDVREPRELEEEGKISQAINIPLCQLKKGLQMAEESFCNTFGISKPSSKTNLVFYGRKHVKGEAASEIACKLGFKKVKHYPGGFDEWRQKEEEQT